MPSENDTPIEIPVDSSEPTEVRSDKEILEMQSNVFNRKKQKREKTKEKAKEKLNGAANGVQQDAQPESVLANGEAKKKNRAEEIFSKTQEANGKIDETQKGKGESPKEKEDKPKEGEFEGQIPLLDESLLLGEEDKKGEAEGEVEVAPEDLEKENNIKNLRTIAGKFKKERDELQTKVAEVEVLQKQLDELKLKNSPEAVALQSKITELESRVAELEPFEFVFALHSNPKFKAKFIDGTQAIVDEMKAIAKDYAIPPETIGDVLYIDNRKELDEFLEETFSSSSARGDIKTLKQKYDGLQKERQEYEKKPQEFLLKLRSDEATREAEKNQKRDLHFKSVFDKGWQKALDGVIEAEDNKIYELIEVPGKKDHNEKVVAPTRSMASKLFHTAMGHVESMIRNGYVIDNGFATWLATICQQAAATQMINHTRYGLYDQNQKLLKESSRQGGYDRPGIGTGVRGITRTSDGQKKSSKQISAEIWSDVVEAQSN